MNDFQRQYLHEMGIDVWLLKPEGSSAVQDITEPAEVPEAGKPVESKKSSQVTSASAANLALVRDQLTGEPAGPSAASSKVPEKESAGSQNPVASKPQFLICFLDYVNLSLVFSLPYETNALPSEHRLPHKRLIISDGWDAEDSTARTA